MNPLFALFSLLGTLVIIVTVIAAWRGTKSKSVAEAANTTANQAASAVDILTKELDVFQGRAERLSVENAGLAAQVENLRQRTDLQPLMERLATVAEETSGRHAVFAQNTEAIAKMVTELFKMNQSLTKKVDAHEQRAQERHEKTVAVLEGIARQQEAA
jgi:hypothetical protein